MGDGLKGTGSGLNQPGQRTPVPHLQPIQWRACTFAWTIISLASPLLGTFWVVPNLQLTTNNAATIPHSYLITHAHLFPLLK